MDCGRRRCDCRSELCGNVWVAMSAEDEKALKTLLHKLPALRADLRQMRDDLDRMERLVKKIEKLGESHPTGSEGTS